MIEWKFTEQYPDGAPTTSATLTATRWRRYRGLYEDPDGPIDATLIGLDDLFVEPVYQLARLAMLAMAIERAN